MANKDSQQWGQSLISRRRLLEYSGAIAVGGRLLSTTEMALAMQNPTVGGSFRAALETAPPSLDLMVNVATATREAAAFVIESLVAYSETFEPIPSLAESWEISDDGLTYTFHLRQGVKFHNGKDFIAEDVIASTDRFLEVTNRAQAFGIVESYEATDDHTVVFQLSQARASFLDTMAFPVSSMGIFPKEIIEGKGTDEITADDLVGTGPYKLVEWLPDQHLLYARFEDHWATEGDRDGMGGNKVPYFDEIQLDVVPEPATRVAGLETGEYNFGAALPQTSYQSIQSNSSLKSYIFEFNTFVVLQFNHTDPLTGDLKFRQAIQAAIDVDAHGRAITSGLDDFYNADASIFFSNTPWHNDESAELYNQANLDRARELLEESSYDGEEVILVANRNYDYMYKTLVALDETLKSELGINTRVDMLDWPGQTARTGGTSDWHIAPTGLSSAPTFGPEGFEAYLVGDSALGHYDNPEMAEIFSLLLEATTVEERQTQARAIQRMWFEDIPMIKTANLSSLTASGADIQNYEPWYLTPRFWNLWTEG